jgi:NAD(P)H dehydrogenase (quinone)
MTDRKRQRTLVTGATGQVGTKIMALLPSSVDVDIVAAVRSADKAATLQAKGIPAVILDLDDDSTHHAALEGVDRLFLMTGYTVDMLRQSKVLLDNAKKAGVQHVVHLGACGRDDTTVAHWA